MSSLQNKKVFKGLGKPILELIQVIPSLETKDYFDLRRLKYDSCLRGLKAVGGCDEEVASNLEEKM